MGFIEGKMTSKEIAELTRKRHSDVMRDVRNLVKSLDNQAESSFALSEYKDLSGKVNTQYLLTKSETLLLISGYNIKLRYAIINRWQELESLKESEKKDKLPTDFLSALEALVVTTRDNIKLQLENDVQKITLEDNKPKVDFFDKVTLSEDCIDIGLTSKVLNLGIGRNLLFKFLREQKILDKDNIPYQKYVTIGYFKSIEGTVPRVNGKTRVTLKTVVFQKGVDFILKTYKKHGNTALLTA